MDESQQLMGQNERLKSYRTLVLVFLGFIVCFIDRSAMNIALAYVGKSFTLTPAQLGVVGSAFFFSYSLMQVPGGWLVDRFGYKKFVIASLTVLMVFSFLFGNVSSLFAILFLRFMVGFGQAGYTNGAPKIISDNYASDQCAKVQSFVVATAGIGGILASTVGAKMIRSNWHHAYYFLSAGYLVALLAVIFLLKEKKVEKVQTQEVAEKIGFFDAWKNKNTILLAISVLFSNLVGVAMLFWLPNVLRVNFGFNDSNVLSEIMVGFYVVMTIAMASGGPIITKFFKGKELTFIFGASVLTAICVVVFIMAPAYEVAIIALYVANFLMMIAFSGLLAVPYQLVPRKMIGSSFAVLNIGAFIGGIISPQLVSALAKEDSYLYSFIGLAVCMVISGVAALLVKKPQEN